MGHGSRRQRDWSTVEKDRWKVDSGQTRSSSGSPPFQSLHCCSREHEFRGKESPSETSTSSEPRLDVQAAMQSRTIKGHRHTQKRCRKRIEERLRTNPHGGVRLDRRSEVINEALPEEVRREEQRKKRSDRAAAAIPGRKPAAPAVSEPREDPIESDPNPKRRLIMKSASPTASGSGQQ